MKSAENKGVGVLTQYMFGDEDMSNGATKIILEKVWGQPSKHPDKYRVRLLKKIGNVPYKYEILSNYGSFLILWVF